MSFNPIARAIALATVGTSLMIPAVSQAAFIEDSTASLMLRNFYFNRDVRDNSSASKHKQEEWGQGFITKFQSGYTEGTVGVGVDVMGNLGVKLDSGRGTSGTGLLQLDQDTGEAQDTYGDLTATAKVKVAKSVLKAGALQLNLPTVSPVDNRLLPAFHQGAHLNSTDIENLTLDLGRINRINLRDSSDQQTLSMANAPAAKYLPAGFVNDSEQFDFFRANYDWKNGFVTSWDYAILEDLYKQHYFNVLHTLPIAQGQSLKTDLRYARTNEDANSGVDNRAFGIMFTYSLQAHKFGLAYQDMSGDTGFAYMSSNNPYLVNYVQIGDYSKAEEKSWQVRYDYDFASLGAPGLTFMTRYVYGDDYQVGGQDASEWERNTEFKYVFPEGSLKGFGVHLRNATYRNNHTTGGDLDENRLILSYTLPLL